MTLLVLDSDLGFLFWLAKALEPGGHSVVPAETVSQATRLMRRLKLPIDVLIVNPLVEGAAAFSEGLRERQPRLKVIALMTEVETESGLPGIRADATRTKPDITGIAGIEADEPALRSEWVQFLQRVSGSRTAGGRAN